MDKKIKKYLGIDWGSRRIGLAMGDSETKIAIPFIVVKNLEEVLSVIEKEEVDKIIIGAPLKMRSPDYPLAEEYLDFLESLRRATEIPVETVDERLSSRAADSLPGDKKTKAGRDAVASMLILQSYFDKL